MVESVLLKTSIIIIGLNEGVSIQDMYNSLKPYNCPIYWVLDRCTDDSLELLKALKQEHIILTPSEWKGRKTSSSRNLGLYFALLDKPFNNILFLDGDRYVKSGSLSELNTWDKDIALLLCEEDNRDLIEDYSSYYGEVYNKFYSCGLFIKNKAVEKICDFQQEGIFDLELETIWGVEDTYLGDVCYSLGLTADIYKNCKLNGSLSNTVFVDGDAVVARFRKRDNLKNIKWDN